MTRYVATTNVPGYLPTDDDPPVFDTAADAWAYLADERRESEDSAWDAESINNEANAPSNYTDTVDALDAYATAGHGPDVVYGSTPGYDGTHDLGLAYCVSIAETPEDVTERLEYLRGEIRAERISYGELAELQNLAPYIDKHADPELAEWAGIPEHDDDDGRHTHSAVLARLNDDDRYSATAGPLPALDPNA